ncbi:hypothetical protein [Rathayibacter sp. SD072]|uniref:hypothetical protein n=1 Tax=Rathayibacter sp. SD072 TaxID=2781731 RepID=UPI001A956F9F|nr:hypothetical protein [Rathayibacter sp. SD072]MBO0982693.1 hypothetical protein [Rathayibacter sp. SD072]
MASLLIAGAVAPGAEALGSAYRTCLGLGEGRVYGVSVSSRAQTYITVQPCNVYNVGVRANYQAYPGASYAWTGWAYNATTITVNQSGTVGGQHLFGSSTFTT